MTSEPKVLIDLKEYNQLKHNDFIKGVTIEELRSELRKAHRTINALKRSLKEVVKNE